ncbi:MAG: right-handed parallel beta-helix repeat-containing protein [Chitinivibrionales bacterium]
MKQKIKSIAAVIVINFLIATSASAATYYVSPTGNDNAAGSLAQPFATLQKGNDAAVAGDTVYLRGGTYSITTPANSGAGISITKSGTSDTKRIYFWAYPGETPLFDFSNLQIANGAYTFGIVISGSWVHLKGIEECCVPMNTKANNGFANNGNNNILELLNAHDNQGSGIQVGSGSGNLALNCDSHDNYDPGSTNGGGAGEDADGFGVHGGTTGTTTIKGCRSWWNSDDGYDFLSEEAPVTIENCYAFGAGHFYYGTGEAGNGNGFKMGSSKTGVRHTIINCVAWGNRANGFYANHSSGGNTWYNNTSFQNGTQYNMLASTWSEPNGGGTRTDGVILTGDKVHIMRNNIGYPDKNSYITGYGVDTKFNTWDLNIVPKASDFLSVTDPSMTTTGKSLAGIVGSILGPRQADGSVPNVNFLKLAAGSQMIDKGTDVGLPYTGTAPDLGAYEYGPATQAKSRPQTAFGSNITVRTGAMLKLEGIVRCDRSAVAEGRTALFTITGQRIYLNNSGSMSIPGIYIEKRL